ncbi:uncharacterized protein [Callorhinus ursinus]|uniref:uncharacterized protein n=1 Tax=Callorhinus ursinus TaxID=34884 RepID=UPI003CD0206D
MCAPQASGLLVLGNQPALYQGKVDSLLPGARGLGGNELGAAIENSKVGLPSIGWPGGGLLEKVTLLPSLTSPDQKWALSASERAWELPGSRWGPWAECWLRTGAFLLARQVAGSLLPKQAPLRLAEGERRKGSWTGLKLRLLRCSEERQPFPRARLSPGPTQAWCGEGSSLSPAALKHHPIPAAPASPSSRLIPFLLISPPGNSCAKSLLSGSSLAASVATGDLFAWLRNHWGQGQDLERTWPWKRGQTRERLWGRSRRRPGKGESRGRRIWGPSRREGVKESFGWVPQSLSWALAVCFPNWGLETLVVRDLGPAGRASALGRARATPFPLRSTAQLPAEPVPRSPALAPAVTPSPGSLIPASSPAPRKAGKGGAGWEPQRQFLCIVDDQTAQTSKNSKIEKHSTPSGQRPLPQYLFASPCFPTCLSRS